MTKLKKFKKSLVSGLIDGDNVTQSKIQLIDKALAVNGDSLSLLKSIPAGSIDVVFADPPYFGNQSQLVISRTDNPDLKFRTDKASWAKSKKSREQIEFHFQWLAEVQRILKTGGTIWVTGTYHSMGYVNVVMHDLKYKILNEIILVKRNAPPNFKGTCFRAMTENMIWAKKDSKGRKTFNYWLLKAMNGGKQMNNVWEYSAKKNPFRHPATKQPSILERVILASSKKGDVILDPFAGSGTTSYVANALGRYSISLEIEPDYFNLICDRLNGKYGRFELTEIDQSKIEK